jgi:hypothetical protein
MLKLSITNVWDIMRYCYMSLTGRHSWDTDTTVVSEKMMQHLFMWNVTREVLQVQGLWLTAVSLPCKTGEGFENTLCRLSTMKSQLQRCRMCSILHCVTFKKSVSLYCCRWQQILYCTVTTEKAAKHIVANRTRKWPHRPIFSASSRCCMNLWMRRDIVLSQQEMFCEGQFSTV